MIYDILIALGSAGISGSRNICKKNQWRKYLLKPSGSSINCSFSTEKNPLLPSIQQLADARLIYSVSAALGHNKESHPECSARVPAIVNALEMNELTPKV
jgi:hypothetical protein